MSGRSANSANHGEAPVVFPPGLHNAFLFAVFNALSYPIILSSPMVLYAKSLGASATVLGIIAGMMPLLVIFQIPAASHVRRVGYRRFVLAGWSTRVMFIFGMALVPLAGVFLNTTSRLSLMLMLLFGFNLSRGISSCAWLPWITSLVPASMRGAYLSREAACVNVASFVVFVLAALGLGEQPHSWQFSILFAFSAVMGMVSLTFLKRIPEAETPAEVRVSAAPVPWREIVQYAPFRDILWLNVVWSAASGGLTAFVVAFLKVELVMSERTILLVTAVSFLGGLSCLWFLGSRMDRLGSKPVLTFSLATWMVIQLGWVAVAGKLLAPTGLLLLGLQCLMGLANALVNMALLRLAMAIIPAMGRNHFFALYSVAGNLTQGIAPVLWGLLIDALGSLRLEWHHLVWNRFSVFFAAVAVVFLAAFALTRRLHEPTAARMDELLKEILIDSPLRFWFRFWPRG
jgi:MFS family permease